MINIYMCRSKSQDWSNPPPATKVLFDYVAETSILGRLMYEDLMRFVNDPKYQIETLGM